MAMDDRLQEFVRVVGRLSGKPYDDACYDEYVTVCRKFVQRPSPLLLGPTIGCIGYERFTSDAPHHKLARQEAVNIVVACGNTFPELAWKALDPYCLPATWKTLNGWTRQNILDVLSRIRPVLAATLSAPVEKSGSTGSLWNVVTLRLQELLDTERLMGTLLPGAEFTRPLLRNLITDNPQFVIAPAPTDSKPRPDSS